MAFDGSFVSHSDHHTKRKLYGSDAWITYTHPNEDGKEDGDYRRNKMMKTGDGATSLLRSNGDHVSDSQQMLCFSSPNSLSYYHTTTCARNTSSVYGSGIKGPFTPSQLIELEHQALIYKYITANAPVPSNLLLPIRKAIQSAAFSLRWGGFHLGFSNTDPEPGRCRRTDGKKWRCSKDAVIDQKYCERHINRGRHRSRKPVEPQNGHSSSRPPPTTTVTKAVPPSISNNTLSLHNLQPLTSTTYMNNEFGLVSSNSLVNPLHKSCQETKSDNPLRQFMDEWPNNHLSADRIELSISIPMPSFPVNETLISLSPPRLSHENIEMASNQKRQENWVPISWENAVGGPLGEVLNSGSNNNSNASSPTGVLQKSTFRYFSSSSAGSSPRISSFTQN